jgi:hypothetical protein
MGRKKKTETDERDPQDARRRGHKTNGNGNGASNCGQLLLGFMNGTPSQRPVESAEQPSA